MHWEQQQLCLHQQSWGGREAAPVPVQVRAFSSCLGEVLAQNKLPRQFFLNYLCYPKDLRVSFNFTVMASAPWLGYCRLDGIRG